MCKSCKIKLRFLKPKELLSGILKSAFGRYDTHLSSNATLCTSLGKELSISRLALEQLEENLRHIFVYCDDGLQLILCFRETKTE